ncbi:MAG: efflux RND transporter permease subunit [Candidatus Cryptobacteroides sp.]
MDFGNWAFRNSKLIYFLIAVLLVGGVLSAYDMSKLEDPEIKVKMAMVVATYPGASAHEVEMEVCDPLEKSIMSIGDVDKVHSYSYNDLALIEVSLKSTTKDDNVEQCWDLLRRKVGDTQKTLPSGSSVMVQDDFGLVYGMMYALTGDGLDENELSDYARLLKREIGNIPGVARVNIYGERQESIDICIRTDRMATLGVAPAEILSTLNGQNSVYYAGYYENGDDRVRVTVSDKFRTAEQIGNMVIQGHEDDQLRLKDIATVEHGWAEPVRNSLEYNGERALGIAVAAASGTDIVKVGKAVEEKLAELEADRLPSGVECHKVFNQPERVTSSLLTFLINLLESVLIVVAILMVSMGFRSGLIIGISLIMIVIGSFLFLGFMDGTMQRVSLGAFILAMGMLVDNAIVIVDGILVDLKMGKPRKEAMTSIGKKTAMPLLGATLIAILSFLPIFLSPDTAGVYVRDLFIVLAVSLLLSWILALVHVPLMADTMMKGHKYEKVEGISSEEGLYNGRVYKALRKSLSFALSHRVLTISIAFVLLGLTWLGYGKMKQGFFPDMVYDQLYMEYKLPEGTNSTRVARDLTEIREWLQQRPEIGDVTTSVGGTPARYNLVRSIATPSLSYGELIINFESAEALEKNMYEIQHELEQMYPDAYLKLKRYNIMYKKYPIELMFSGPDPAVLHALSDSAMAIMNNTPEVCLVTTDWEPSVPVLEIDYDQPASRRAGLSRQDVSMSLLSASGGLPVGAFYDGVHKNTIYVKCVEEDGNQVDNLENVPLFQMIPDMKNALTEENMLKLRNGTLDMGTLVESALQTIPLKQISPGVSVKWEDPVVPRYNGQRTQKVMCSPVEGQETERTRRLIADKIEAIELPAGYSLTWEGEKGASDETMSNLFANIPLGVVLIIAVLILLFKDYRKPLIIICCVPLLAIGVVAAMLLTGKTFTFCAIVGMLGLVGMMMKNCIVLMDEIGDQIASGKEPSEALISSSESRLRPVLMASMTTILGMIPLVNDAMFGSMAVTIMGGLLFSTIATLFFVPLLYAMFFRIKTRKQ